MKTTPSKFLLAMLSFASLLACGGQPPSAASSSAPATTASPSGTAPVPTWFVGTYSSGAVIENNVAMKSSETLFVIDAPSGNKGKYSFGPSNNLESGEYEITAAGAVEVKTGPVKWKPMFSDNCRILKTPTDSLFRSGVVENCPKAVAPSPAECKLIGTYTKSSKSGTSSSSYEAATTVQIDRDYFYSSTRSTSQSACYGNTCKSLYSSDKPTVGIWKLSVSNTIDTPSIAGYEFAPEEGACGGSSSMTPSNPTEPESKPEPKEVCGNNVCLGAETCSSCPSDCGKCPQKYGACTESNQCDGVECVDFEGGGMCSENCGTNAHCPAAPTGSGLGTMCGGQAFNIYFCLLNCTHGGTCPTGTTCTQTKDPAIKLCAQ